MLQVKVLWQEGLDLADMRLCVFEAGVWSSSECRRRPRGQLLLKKYVPSD